MVDVIVGKENRNQKGFTLVEVIGVIAVLGILSTIVVISVSFITDKMRKSYYEKQSDLIVLAGKDYFSDHRNKLPKEDGKISKVSLKTLIDSKYIDPVVGTDHIPCEEESYSWVQKESNGHYQYHSYLKCYKKTNADTKQDDDIDYESEIDKEGPMIEVSNPLRTYVGKDFFLLKQVKVTDEGSGVDRITAEIANQSIDNTKELDVGKYEVVYTATDNLGNSSSKTITLFVNVESKKFPYTGTEEEYIIPASGNYKITVTGAQGANQGGKGGKVEGTIYLQKNDQIIIRVGGQNGYNGGGIGPGGTDNGGGATTIFYQGRVILTAAGGGGGIGGTAGGSGTGEGGPSVGAQAGTKGTDGGGGSSSQDHRYVSGSTEVGGECIRYAEIQCIKWGPAPIPGCPDCNGYDPPSPNCCCYTFNYCNGLCPPCEEYAPSYSIPIWSTNYGKGGYGGKNSHDKDLKNVTETNGVQGGNGIAIFDYVDEEAL